MPTVPSDERQYRLPHEIHQETLTVVIGVTEERPLRDALDRLGPQVFAAPELGIHFARLAVLPKDARAPDAHACLTFETNFDTALDDSDAARVAHLGALSRAQLGALREVFQYATGGSADASPEDLAALWTRNLVPSTASYQGHANRDLARIRLEERLRQILLTFLEHASAAPPFELFQRVSAHVRAQTKSDPELRGLDLDAPPPAQPDPEVRSKFLRHRDKPWLENLTFRDTPPILARIPQVLWWDAHDAVYDVRAHQEAWTPDDHRAFTAIARTEDHGVHNALTHLVPLREGWGRDDLLKHVHAYLDRVSKRYFAYVGQLGGIPSIHFAKWLLVDSGRRLLFFSNYDGSWESYLGDFVDQAADGLNLAWACSQEYPRTHLLALGGANDEETFKAWGRAYQLPTQVFYAAYPRLTIGTINNNSLIRHRLHLPADAGGLDAWFRRVT